MGDAAGSGGDVLADAFGIGEVRAVRTFRLGPDGRLYPLSNDEPWADGANTARCQLGHGHRSPAPGCRCGFYAYGHPAWTTAQPPARAVLAVCAFWGGVEVASRGLRAAEYGRIEGIWLQPARVGPQLRRSVRARYPNVPVYDDRQQLLTEHPLTVLDDYQPPRLRGRGLRLLAWLAAILAGAVAIVGFLPA